MYIDIFSYQCGPLRERGRVMENEKLSTAMAVTFPCVLIGQSTSVEIFQPWEIILRFASHLN